MIVKCTTSELSHLKKIHVNQRRWKKCQKKNFGMLKKVDLFLSFKKLWKAGFHLFLLFNRLPKCQRHIKWPLQFWTVTKVGFPCIPKRPASLYCHVLDRNSCKAKIITSNYLYLQPVRNIPALHNLEAHLPFK